MKNFRVFLLIILGISLVFTAKSPFLSEADAQSSNTDTADVIAVRIIPNPNHYSIVRWYESQGFSGAPQALVVDGYEAIRDGRTVYVNAANVDTNSQTIYTNIYLISYNQNPAPKTVDILGQIVAHWKFNNNITESTNPVPDCSISATACNLEADCTTDQYCATSSAGIASSSCLLKKPKNCLVDTDCPNTLFCNSVKSKITRDIKRVGQLEELKEALFNFKNHNNYYPRLSSGTYLAGNSLSVWPSWTQSLLADAAVSQNFLDPINRLGVCLGYDVKTCWNSDLKKFIYNPSGSTLTLPSGSYAFAYSTDVNGSNYNLCAVMESRAVSLNYHFSPNDPVSSACVTATGIISGGTAENTAPRLVDQFLIGQADREFSGFLKVVDFENNPLTWSISGPPWVSLQDTSDPTQKKVYASNAATPGTYDLNLTVSDGQGGILATTTKITILADAPRIEAADAEYVLDPTVPFNYNFTFSSNNLSNPATAYSVVKTSGLPDVLNGSGLSRTFGQLPSKDYKVTYTGIIPFANKFYQDASVNYRINLTDSNGNIYPKTFNLRIIVNQPQLNFDCAVQTRVGNDYTCLLGSRIQGNHTLSYAATGLPSGLSLTGATSTIISGRPTSAPSDYPISIKTTNEYGASTSKAFILKVNNYCGDGFIQSPNTESRGGIYNDGYEDCDGLNGVASSPAQSTIDAQYGCRTEVGSSVPNPILTNTYCVFKSPLLGGGYCGDSYCQASIGGQTMETCSNCSNDCGICPCLPSCANKTCGPDGCNGNCGLCEADTAICYADNCCVPQCADKICGADGCGGRCGLCPNASLCSVAGGQCCPQKADIQVCADDAHSTYFNGLFVGSGNNWKNVEKINVTIQPGKNVMAIKATDFGVLYGFSATLNQAPCNSMTTSDIAGWKCTGIFHTGWNTIDYNDSSWPVAYDKGNIGSPTSSRGNVLPYKQIWAADANRPETTIYCRYTFYNQLLTGD